MKPAFRGSPGSEAAGPSGFAACRFSLRRGQRWRWVVAGFFWAAASGVAGQFFEKEVAFSTATADLAGTLMAPQAAERVPCVVLVGGMLSQTRDGALVDRAVPPRDALRRLADALAAGGYASLRYDRVGFGGSRQKQKRAGTYGEDARAAAAAIVFARHRPEFRKIIVIGESAGAYLACWAAKDGVQADGYIFLGALCGPAVDMYQYNLVRLVKYAESKPENLTWVKEHARRDLALGRHYRELFEAAAAGRSEWVVEDDGFKATFDLTRRREELKFPPDELFRHIRAPALALAGEKDLVVRPEHAARAERIMREAGNSKAASALIPEADHNFQRAAEDPEVALRERYTFESLQRTYVPAFYHAVLEWLRQTAPSPLGASRAPAGPPAR